MAEQEVKGKKARKKKWFTLVTDGLFGNAFLGESLVYGSQDLNGRIMAVNLMTLTNDMKQQSHSVRFKINEIREDTAIGSLISYEIMPSSIKRMVRKDVERVDGSFVATTSDGIKLRVKQLLVTKTSTTRSRSKLLRRMSTEFLVSMINKGTYDDFCRGVIGKGLQVQLKAYLKKVFPLKACEIRSFAIVTRGTPLQLTGGKIELPAEPKPREERTVSDEPKEDEQQEPAVEAQ